LVQLPEGAKCCEGIISVSAADLPFRQRFTPGSTAWRKSYRRRNVVEGVNAFLKGGFVNIGQKFFRVFRLTKPDEADLPARLHDRRLQRRVHPLVQRAQDRRS
jgi:hypothetical protein